MRTARQARRGSPEREIQEWFIEVIEMAVEEDARERMTAPYERLQVDPDGGYWFSDGKGGEFSVTLTVESI